MQYKKITNTDISNLDKIKRINLINSLPGFKSANLIGTCDKKGNSNLAVFSSVIHLGSNPAVIGFIMRPLVVSRHTYNNIKETGFYTINHINNEIFEQAHQTSAKYEENISEFESCGFTEEYLPDFTAPFVKESVIKIGMQFKEEYHLKINDTVLIIGEIKYIFLPEKYLENDYYIDLESAGTVAISGLEKYHKTMFLKRLSYARPPK